MKQSEKLDLLLRGIYQHKDLEYACSTDVILKEIGLVIPFMEMSMLMDRLEREGYITPMGMSNGDWACRITSEGIDYCEEDSFSNRGHSLITNHYNISVSGSSNTSVVQNSQNVTITNNSDANKIISELRTAIESIRATDPLKSADITDCLNEVESVINDGKIPKYSFTSLLSIASDLATVAPVLYPLVKSLGTAIGIPLP